MRMLYVYNRRQKYCSLLAGNCTCVVILSLSPPVIDQLITEGKVRLLKEDARCKCNSTYYM